MKKVVHLICNAHIDPIWQWDWPEGASATLSTFQSAVNLADEFDYIFCHNEVTVYKYVEEFAPALFARIQELVKLGKWHIMGGWYLQPDCNMPSGESFVRQMQEGRRYFKEKFGKEPTTAINFDPFGHTVGLVQILKKCGYDGYLFMRPYQWDTPLPAEQFIWKGLDGSEIKTVRTNTYSSPLGHAVENIKEKVSVRPEEEDNICVLWGVGNHGGGPSKKDLADITAMMQEENADFRYIHSTPEELIANINPTAIWDKSLRISMPGCYTSLNKIKKLHAKLESELYMTEKMLSTAYAEGALNEYPEEKIHEITQDLLNAEFHDVLPGSCVQSGEDNGIMYLNHGLLYADKLKNRAFFSLLAAEDPAANGEYPIVVFNPHPYTVKENVECEFMLADQNWDEENVSRIRIVDENGKPVKHQVIKEESNLNLDWRKRVIFEAELKPLQLNRYSVYIEFKGQNRAEKRENLVYDDDRKYVEIDEKTGLLKRYAIDGVDYVTDGFLPVMFDDNADPWGMSPSQRLRMGENEQPFVLSQKPSGVFAGMKSIQIVEDGDICWGVEAFFEKDATRVRILYKIYKNNDFIDLDVRVFMGDVNKFVKLKMPVAVQGKLIGQTAFGTEELYMDARENVAHRFVAVENGDKCVALMNDSVYGSHFENGSLYMSLVRGITYCAHPIADRELIPSDRFTKKADQGENRFSFRLGVLDRSQLERATQEFIQKSYALSVFPTPRTAEKKTFDVALGDDTVSLVTMKKADGRTGILFRLLNNTEKSVETDLTVYGTRLPLVFGKNEVKTVLYEDGKLTELDQLII